jgi:dihydrofolate reductase
MARIILSLNVTLDGCYDHMQVIADDEHHRHVTALLEGASALLLGRNTYDLFESHWPAVAESGVGSPDVVTFARTLDAKPRYVVTSRHLATSWAGTVPISGDLHQENTALKRGLPGYLIIFGSPGLARSLADRDLIDDYQLAVQPIVAGHGPRLFDGLREPIRLAHVETHHLRSGVALTRYTALPQR